MAKNEYALRYASSCLNAISEANLPMAKRFIDWKVHQDRRTTGTIGHYCQRLRDLDRFLKGKPYEKIDHLDLDAFIRMRSQTLADSSLYTEAKEVQHFMLWVHRETKDPDTAHLPYRMHMALKVRRKTHRPKKERPVTPEERDALLQVAKPYPMYQALYWMLWDSGFRIGELLSLNHGSVVFEEDRGVTIWMPEVEEGQKTGQRHPYLYDCAPSLRAWMSVHPLAGDDDAPLFTSTNRPYRRLTYSAVYQKLRRDLKTAGLRSSIHPHLFRKTSATRRAKSGWDPDKLKLFHGWSPDSQEASTYILYAKEDMREQIRRDAGADDLGARLVNDQKPCPYCAEPIKAAARKCRHCGEFVDAARPRPRPDRERR